MKFVVVLTVLFLGTGCATTESGGSPEPPLQSPASPFTVVATSEVVWEQLNPARGDKSPSAANLWGDRKREGPTGFLAKFIDGFQSPPHVHNVTYRAVVLSGRIHNDDPDAEEMWMPAGSFWTQPKGALHITSAKDEGNLIYVEIDEGPYLVRPPESAFDSGEEPINVDPTNLVWLSARASAWIESGEGPARPQIAHLWGETSDGALNGSFIRWSPTSTVGLASSSEGFRAVVVQGQVEDVAEGAERRGLGPGALLKSTGANHLAACAPQSECVLYVRGIGPVYVWEPAP